MKHPKRRLGAGPDDATPIKAHPFFRGINWAELVLKSSKPPFKPQLKNRDDILKPQLKNRDDILKPQFFEAEFTSQAPILTPTASIKLM